MNAAGMNLGESRRSAFWVSARLALVGFSAIAALGCKKSEQSQTGATGTPPAAQARAPQDINTGVRSDEILLGQPAAFSGPSAGLGVEMWRGARAFFDRLNDAGGVNGRKVKLVLADDGYEAERAAPAVVKLAEQERVFAIFGGVGTPTIVRALPAVRKYYDDSGLFYFSNFTGAQPQRQPPYAQVVFNVRASYYQETKAIVDAFVVAGKKRIGTFVQDDAYGTDGREGVKRALKDHNLSLAADTRYPRGQKFETANATAVKILQDAKVDAVVAVGSYQACGGFVRDARDAGLDVPLHNVSFVGADQMLQLLAKYEKESGKKLTRRLINTQVVPHYSDTTVPVVVEYRQAMEKYNPTIPSEIGDKSYSPPNKFSFGSLEGYVSAKAFAAVLEKAGRDVNRKNFYETAESMGQFDLGLAVPAEFSAARHQALDKVWFTYATSEGWKPTDSIDVVIK